MSTVLTSDYLIGIDEVGRGCWAGPLVACAVMLDPGNPIAGLNDSKKLSRSQRQALSVRIHEQAVAIGIGWVWPPEVDADGLTSAVRSAMRQALAQLLERLPDRLKTLDLSQSVRPADIPIVIDGNYNYLPERPTAVTMIGADGKVAEASAASIVAKVARDTYMMDTAALKYPQYGFEQHVGYGTAAHIAALREYGVTDIHRRTYKPIQRMLLQSNA